MAGDGDFILSGKFNIEEGNLSEAISLVEAAGERLRQGQAEVSEGGAGLENNLGLAAYKEALEELMRQAAHAGSSADVSGIVSRLNENIEAVTRAIEQSLVEGFARMVEDIRSTGAAAGESLRGAGEHRGGGGRRGGGSEEDRKSEREDRGPGVNIEERRPPRPLTRDEIFKETPRRADGAGSSKGGSTFTYRDPQTGVSRRVSASEYQQLQQEYGQRLTAPAATGKVLPSPPAQVPVVREEPAAAQQRQRDTVALQERSARRIEAVVGDAGSFGQGRPLVLADRVGADKPLSTAPPPEPPYAQQLRAGTETYTPEGSKKKETRPWYEYKDPEDIGEHGEAPQWTRVSPERFENLQKEYGGRQARRDAPDPSELSEGASSTIEGLRTSADGIRELGSSMEYLDAKVKLLTASNIEAANTFLKQTGDDENIQSAADKQRAGDVYKDTVKQKALGDITAPENDLAGAVQAGAAARKGDIGVAAGLATTDANVTSRAQGELATELTKNRIAAEKLGLTGTAGLDPAHLGVAVTQAKAFNVASLKATGVPDAARGLSVTAVDAGLKSLQDAATTAAEALKQEAADRRQAATAARQAGAVAARAAGASPAAEIDKSNQQAQQRVAVHEQSGRDDLSIQGQGLVAQDTLRLRQQAVGFGLSDFDTASRRDLQTGVAAARVLDRTGGPEATSGFSTTEVVEALRQQTEATRANTEAERLAKQREDQDQRRLNNAPTGGIVSQLGHAIFGGALAGGGGFRSATKVPDEIRGAAPLSALAQGFAGGAGYNALFALQAGIFSAITAATALDRQFRLLQTDATAVGASSQQWSSMKQNILNIGDATGVATTDIATLAQGFLGLYGNVNVANGALQGAAELLAITGESAAQLGPEIGAVVQGFGLSTTQVANADVTAGQRSDRTPGDISAGVAALAPVAAAQGLTANETYGLIVAASKGSSSSAADIGAGFDRILTALPGQITTLTQYGIHFKDPSNNFSNIEDLISQTKNSPYKADIIQAEGGPRNAAFLSSLINNPASLIATQGNYTDNNAAAIANAAIQKSLTASFDRLKDSAEKFGLALEQGALGKTFEDLAAGGEKVVGAFTDLVTVVSFLNKAAGGVPAQIAALVVGLTVLKKVGGNIGDAVGSNPYADSKGRRISDGIYQKPTPEEDLPPFPESTRKPGTVAGTAADDTAIKKDTADTALSTKAKAENSNATKADVAAEEIDARTRKLNAEAIGIETTAIEADTKAKLENDAAGAGGIGGARLGGASAAEGAAQGTLFGRTETEAAAAARGVGAGVGPEAEALALGGAGAGFSAGAAAETAGQGTLFGPGAAASEAGTIAPSVVAKGGSAVLGEEVGAAGLLTTLGKGSGKLFGLEEGKAGVFGKEGAIGGSSLARLGVGAGIAYGSHKLAELGLHSTDYTGLGGLAASGAIVEGDIGTGAGAGYAVAGVPGAVVGAAGGLGFGIYQDADHFLNKPKVTAEHGENTAQRKSSLAFYQKQTNAMTSVIEALLAIASPTDAAKIQKDVSTITSATGDTDVSGAFEDLESEIGKVGEQKGVPGKSISGQSAIYQAHTDDKSNAAQTKAYAAAAKQAGSSVPFTSVSDITSAFDAGQISYGQEQSDIYGKNGVLAAQAAGAATGQLVEQTTARQGLSEAAVAASTQAVNDIAGQQFTAQTVEGEDPTQVFQALQKSLLAVEGSPGHQVTTQVVLKPGQLPYDPTQTGPVAAGGFQGALSTYNAIHGGTATGAVGPTGLEGPLGTKSVPVVGEGRFGPIQTGVYTQVPDSSGPTPGAIAPVAPQSPSPAPGATYTPTTKTTTVGYKASKLSDSDQITQGQAYAQAASASVDYTEANTFDQNKLLSFLEGEQGTPVNSVIASATNKADARKGLAPTFTPDNVVAVSSDQINAGAQQLQSLQQAATDYAVSQQQLRGASAGELAATQEQGDEQQLADLEKELTSAEAHGKNTAGLKKQIQAKQTAINDDLYNQQQDAFDAQVFTGSYQKSLEFNNPAAQGQTDVDTANKEAASEGTTPEAIAAKVASGQAVSGRDQQILQLYQSGKQELFQSLATELQADLAIAQARDQFNPLALAADAANETAQQIQKQYGSQAALDAAAANGDVNAKGLEAQELTNKNNKILAIQSAAASQLQLTQSTELFDPGKSAKSGVASQLDAINKAYGSLNAAKAAAAAGNTNAAGAVAAYNQAVYTAFQAALADKLGPLQVLAAQQSAKGNVVGAADTALKEAEAAVAAFKAASPQDAKLSNATYAALVAAVATAKGNVLTTTVSFAETQIQELIDTNGISIGQGIQRLQALYAQAIKAGDSSEALSIKDQIQQYINQGNQNAQFDLPNINLPTLYEARRSEGTRGGTNYYGNTGPVNVNININGNTDTTAAVNQIARAVGGSPTTGNNLPPY